MENSKDVSVTNQPNEMPHITNESASFLLTAAKWGKFLAILGFVFTGLMILAGIFMSFALGMLPEEMAPLNLPFSARIFSVIYIIIAGIYIVPVISLNSFCNNVIKAVNLSSTEYLTKSIRNLKRLFVFIGVSTIVILSIYILAIVMVGIAALTGF
jgi:hypothetical protein